MSRFMVVFSALLFISLSGCTVSKLDTASNETKYEEEQTTQKRSYEIESKDNISRVSFYNQGGSESDVQIVFNRSNNANVPKDITFRGSSGYIENTATYRGFRDVEYPFTGTVTYDIKPKLSRTNMSSSKQGARNSNSASDLKCRLTFTIFSPGSWEVNVVN